jgi:hypothetical protein
VDEGDTFLTENTVFEEDDDLKKYYDSYPQTTSWAVLQLCVHRTIRKVGKGEELDNKYCFWPMSQPWVNHRPIDAALVGGDKGFINSLSTQQNVEWSTQEGISMPYSVTDEAMSSEENIDNLIFTRTVLMIWYTRQHCTFSQCTISDCPSPRPKKKVFEYCMFFDWLGTHQ